MDVFRAIAEFPDGVQAPHFDRAVTHQGGTAEFKGSYRDGRGRRAASTQFQHLAEPPRPLFRPGNVPEPPQVVELVVAAIPHGPVSEARDCAAAGSFDLHDTVESAREHR